MRRKRNEYDTEESRVGPSPLHIGKHAERRGRIELRKTDRTKEKCVGNDNECRNNVGY